MPAETPAAVTTNGSQSAKDFLAYAESDAGADGEQHPAGHPPAGADRRAS